MINSKKLGSPTGSGRILRHSSLFLLLIASLITLIPLPLNTVGGQIVVQSSSQTTPVMTNSSTSNNNNHSNVPAKTESSEGSACRKLMMIVAKRLVKHLKPCNDALRQIYPSNKAFSDHFQCTVRCFLQNVKLTNDKHQMTNETLLAFVSEQIPEKYQNLTLRLQTKCFQTFAYKLDVMDEYCKSHGAYLLCLQNEISGKC